MTDTILLKSDNFSLSLDFEVFEADIAYPSNTILSVSVSSVGFSASTTMDVDIKDILTFCNKLQNLYTSLNGEAKIQEPFGNRQYIQFSGDPKGHIMVLGTLNSNGENGFWQELKFENRIDQTFLLDFIKKLTALSNQYVR
jgi:hypothetical protein